MAYYSYLLFRYYIGSKMTGKEKIQVVIDEINKEYQALIAGNVIEIDSDTLVDAGLSVGKQKQALDVLANDNKYIQYTFESKQTVDTEDTTPFTAVWIMQNSRNSETMEETLARLLEPCIYTIEVLDNFESTINGEPEVSPETKAEVEAAQLHEVIHAEQGEKPTVDELEARKLPHSPYLRKLELNPLSYDKSKGILHLDSFHEIRFVEKGKVKRKDKDGKKGETYEQPRLLECVFKTVNTLEKGVLFSTVLGVHKDFISEKHQSKIENTVYEINQKAKKQMGVKSLIKIQGDKVVLNNSYL